MIKGFDIKTIDDVEIKNKRVLVRADFDVALNEDLSIADDTRIRQNIPTLKHLLKNGNRIICLAKMNRPKVRDPRHSLKIVVDALSKYITGYSFKLIDDFLTEDRATFENQSENEVFVLENMRYYPQDKTKDPQFAEKLASLGDIFVMDGFAVAHRIETSVIGIPRYLPSYAGLLVKKEVENISKAIRDPKKPVVSIIGGIKVSTKIAFISRLLQISDFLLIGGGLANTFIAAQGYNIGKSVYEYEEVEKARHLLYLGGSRGITQILPQDVVVGDPEDNHVKPRIVDIEHVEDAMHILDIGPKTCDAFGEAIGKAHTIIWNGPMGMFEKPAFSKGSDHIYHAIIHNKKATSLIGGGDTLAILNGKHNTEKITHISTGGGAMLEFIEKGTLPGLEALKASQKKFSI